MQVSSFFKGLASLLLLNAIIKTFWIFGVDANVQIAIGNTAYGKFYSIINFALLLNVLLDFGLSNYWLAYNDDTSKNTTIVFQTKIIFSVLYVIAFIVLGLLLTIKQTNLWLPIILLQIGNSFIVFFRYMLQQKEKYNTNSIFSVFDRIVAAIIILAAIFIPNYFFSIDGEAYAWVQAASIVLSNIIVYFVFFKNVIKHNKVQWDALKKILSKALPFALLILLMTFLLRLDVFFINLLHHDGYNEVATYTYGFRFLDALNNFGFMIASFSFAFFCKYKNDKAAIKNVSNKLVLLMLGGTLLLLVTLFFTNNYFAGLIYNNATNATKQLMLLGTASFIGVALVHVYGSLLTATLHLKLFSTIVTCCLCIAVVLHLIFTPKYGAIAAAYITAVVQLLLGISCWVACKRKAIV